ncbi:MAG: efflux RND transporter periplasmic adaptor subunit [candidate division WOR-3 bacterium]|nr:efflux RND transporter periplasmic adaptor subunit [candidate division WOR-3 bacterium]
MKKTLIIISVIIVVALIIILNLRQDSGGERVEVEVVKRGEIVSKVSADGELKAKAQVDISAETIGRIKKIYYKEGDFVKKGSLLIEIDDTQAKANYKLSEVRFKQAEQVFNRTKSLYEKGLISKENFENAELNYESAKATYEQALDTYKKTKIYAPISGKVMKLNIEEGETAVMGTLNYVGTVLATIADMSRMIAVVKIDETEVPKVKLGQEAEVIADALPDSIFKGKVVKVGLMPVTSITPTTEKATDFEVEIELDNYSERLRPGMNVKAEIFTGKKANILKVPIQAVGKRKVKDKLTESIFVVKRRRAVLKEIQTGISSDTEIEVISGINENDTVVVGPYRVLSKLKDGARVEFKGLEKGADE